MDDGAAEEMLCTGWYSFQYEGGECAVCFRPGPHPTCSNSSVCPRSHCVLVADSRAHSAGGRFHCAEYPAAATWSRHGLGITIDWKEFGEYEMRIDPATKAMAGCVKGAPADWRRALFVKALSPVETLLFGRGGGTEWKFEWSGGSFGIQLKAGGDNQLACPSYPDETARFALDAHGSGNALEINWGKYGQ